MFYNQIFFIFAKAFIVKVKDQILYDLVHTNLILFYRELLTYS